MTRILARPTHRTGLSDPHPRAVLDLIGQVEEVYATGPTGYRDPSVRHTLRTARELIMRYGWTRGTLCDRHGLCLLGSVQAAALAYDPALWAREVRAAELQLMTALNTRDPHDLPRFNNAQTWAGPVLDLLIRAAR
ncbi:hypothetical protein AVW11_03945 [Streptomyces amritsarensis]|uniref:Uncharacterized protein n=1 Tax=Streptomyces amritsarensis TaxID=681158 RepID=A0ABX3GCN6_9ACTN|nr:hypothetical protein [Streptomyces amritsarensis]OLZ72553.1 hypothetical protein AVW11_03945 [Streptomyces amritsarensis]